MYWIAHVRVRETGKTKKLFIEAPYSKERTREILVSAYGDTYVVTKLTKDKDPNAGVKYVPCNRQLVSSIVEGGTIIGDTQ